MTDTDLSSRIVNVLEGVGRGKVRKAGGDNVILRCPFHEDNTPSFCMNVHNGLFICYGCDVQGNFKKFLQMLGMTPGDIDLQFGVTLKKLSKNAPPPKDKARPDVVMEVNRHIEEDLLGLFHFCPDDLVNEGFTEETLKHFRVGVDKQHSRITFPLRDISGHLVGISGRAMSVNQEPRYKVYLEEYVTWGLPPYNTDKGNLLWNAHTLFKELKFYKGEPPWVVVVEGFKAAMWVHQAGFPRVVALMTKRMSMAQEWILNHMGAGYILMLDNDAAGVAGTINVSRSLYKTGTPLRIAEYSGDQPTDVPLDELPSVIESACTCSNLLHIQ